MEIRKGFYAAAFAAALTLPAFLGAQAGDDSANCDQIQDPDKRAECLEKSEGK